MSEPLDLSIALRKLHELALAEGDLGYAYWFAVARLLKDAQRMADRVRDLEVQVAQMSARGCNAKGQPGAPRETT
jgi:hypothetical protein